VTPVRTIVRKDALKQPAAGSLPVPSELRAAIRKVTAAYERGDSRIRESAAAVPRQLVFVAKGDLASRAVHEKSMSFDQVVKRGDVPATGGATPTRVADPRREAVRVFRGLDGPAAVPRRNPEPGARIVPSGLDGRAVNPAAAPAGTAPAPARFRDWNPDLRLARELGVRIEYSSVRNEVRCPELGLSSRDRERPSGLTPRLTSHGVSYGPASSDGGSASGGSSPSGSTSSTSPRASSERSSSSSGSKEAKSGGGSEKIKN
jgi:hypothetical protein